MPITFEQITPFDQSELMNQWREHLNRNPEIAARRVCLNAVGNDVNAQQVEANRRGGWCRAISMHLLCRTTNAERHNPISYVGRLCEVINDMKDISKTTIGLIASIQQAYVNDAVPTRLNTPGNETRFIWGLRNPVRGGGHAIVLDCTLGSSGLLLIFDPNFGLYMCRWPEYIEPHNSWYAMEFPPLTTHLTLQRRRCEAVQAFVSYIRAYMGGTPGFYDGNCVARDFPSLSGAAAVESWENVVRNVNRITQEQAAARLAALRASHGGGFLANITRYVHSFF